MNNSQKYTTNFFFPPKSSMSWTEKMHIQKAPIWCSVDLRDGNQALIIPLSLEEKIVYFKELVKIGFKEIEIGFPAASQTEYDFCRTLIEKNLIPDDVKIQVLTQARPHIIKRTFEAIKGCKNAIVHLYNSTSVAQREQVFKCTKDEIIKIAIDGAKLFNEYKKNHSGKLQFEYSPESFTGTEPQFALDICNAVIDVWEPTCEEKVIINLPVTVENSMPHIYACQVEFMCENLHNRENLIISLHPHNDRGCAVADAEFGLLAGAQRVEGTLFGNGERTGNVDIVTLALNMYSQGTNPELDFSDLPKICNIYEKITHMQINDRQPYSGSLVFAAFSGSHQDAIAKGMSYREEKEPEFWNVPYLPIDPKDIGREYGADVIRINSQSGKGGIGYILEKTFGFVLPEKLRENFGYHIKNISDMKHKELSKKEIYEIFINDYVNLSKKIILEEVKYSFNKEVEAFVEMSVNNEKVTGKATGNGHFSASSNAIKRALGKEYSIVTYQEHALEKSSKSQAAAYVGIDIKGEIFWGVGIHTDIVTASIYALVSALNRAEK